MGYEKMYAYLFQHTYVWLISGESYNGLTEKPSIDAYLTSDKITEMALANVNEFMH